MKTHPLLMSAPMVLATLREIETPGTGKTVTRRLPLNPVPDKPKAECHPKHQRRHPEPYLDAYCGERPTEANPRGMSSIWQWWQVDDRMCWPQFDVRYATGDLIYVRETWRPREGHGAWDMYVDYAADGSEIHFQDGDADNGDWNWPKAAAKGNVPGIHMPRWASRITLEVTSVKVERLQDITEEQAHKEGIERLKSGRGYYDPTESKGMVHLGHYLPSAKAAFEILWDSLNGKPRKPGGPDISWDANPWVVAIGYTPHLVNVDSWEARK
ncbi:MAG: hypothetical protein ACPGFA_01180 [Pikeienuella sp.]